MHSNITNTRIMYPLLNPAFEYVPINVIMHEVRYSPLNTIMFCYFTEQ